jgi:hypothetical protein
MKHIHLALIALAAVLPAFAKEPVITKETREENGKKVEYMFIDGVKVHEEDPAKQPQPEIVAPKPYDATAAKAPEGATVLFDGTEATMENWSSMKGEPTKWKLVDGAMESVRGAGYIRTKQEFGSCRLHIEFASPAKPEGSGQGRGNSGVFLMGKYEVQVLDSYENKTYPDGQCGALYGRNKPLVNASRGPGVWQTYDIIFTAPRFDERGLLLVPAYVTVLHNGVLVQNHTEVLGTTAWHMPPSYQSHGPREPISLQFHGNPIRYRNIWIRPIKDSS